MAYQNECKSCEPGKYCQGYAITNLNLNNNISGDCSSGYYCKLGVKFPKPNENSTGTGGVCPKGYYCPSGTSDPVPCPIGRFSDTLGLKMESECRSCTFGHYCGTTGLNQTSGMLEILN